MSSQIQIDLIERDRCGLGNNDFFFLCSATRVQDMQTLEVYLQGLFVPFARVGSRDPVRVLHLLHNKYTGYN